ncbi:hypothetical protein [Rubritalea profundi]|nr:hypothetical protein [Rubritalea profundi]
MLTSLLRRALISKEITPASTSFETLSGIITGILVLRISWTSLTFKQNKEHAYDFHDLDRSMTASTVR